ncbi:Phage lysis protein, holin [Oceanobacillus oncorhynchi]|uniref:Phage lysis protein, holin n=1 Tax=Oceanobacillus oncorhynchi TaxID=545501 RepID=A0A0A1MNX1_9BACI|nr:phage holin [Oceanobacillus oncorhynchi]CEI81317.1 Phage lysis protein, holin [Oceanobacillus oncorhynchi]
MKEKLQKINNKWVRLVVFVIVAVNSGFMMAGYELLPFDNDQIVTGLSIFAMILSEIWNHWKNNSYTGEAQEADRILKASKDDKARWK